MSARSEDGFWMKHRFDFVWRDAERTFYRGHRARAGDESAAVLAVMPTVGGSHSPVASLLLQEFRLRESLNATWAAQPVDFLQDQGALLLRDPNAELLATRIGQAPGIDDFLCLAISLAESVQGMHESGIVHKNIRPGNILVDAATREARLTGFGSASKFREHLPVTPAEMLAGAMPYMAPEQTGRMNRPVDVRTDLYSVGVTFYEVLAGTLPFRAGDAMEWIHCHLARKPVPLSDMKPGLPQQLSSIVMKLLEKDPDNRYQSAAALAHDLRRSRSEWSRTGAIPPFHLGKRQAPAPIRFRPRLYGREGERSRLRSALAAVIRTGERQLVLVSGYSGIGKSSLVTELQAEAAAVGGLFACGKFDQYNRGIPYAALAQAFRRLVGDVLATPEQELARWRVELAKALERNARLMVPIVPGLARLLGEQAPAGKLLDNDARSRFRHAFRSFVRAFAQPEHPLILFLDDLQWLDAATLDIFQSLATDRTVRSLLLIGAYRSNEVEDGSPLRESLRAIRQAAPTLAEIELAGIGAEHAVQMVSDAMATPPAEVRQLVDCVLQKTGANPFFTKQFVGSLADNGLLRYDATRSRWDWDVDQISLQQPAGDVVDLMIERLLRLPPSALRAVQALACMESPVAPSRLCAGLQEEEGDVKERLQEVIGVGLILESPEGYAFAHDRIREAAYAMLNDSEKTELHLRIAESLLRQLGDRELEEHLFEVVNHLNRAALPGPGSPAYSQGVTLNLRAGRKARRAAAYNEACGYLARGRSLLASSSPADQHKLMLDMSLELAECTFLAGDLDDAAALVGELVVMAQTDLELAAVYRLKVELHVVNSENRAAVEESLTALHRLGVTLEEHPTREAALAACERVRTRMENQPLESLARRRPMKDPRKLAAMRLLAETWPPAYFTDFNLAVVVICMMAELSLDHGYSDASNQGFALMGWLMGPVSSRYDDGYRLCLQAAEIASQGESTIDIGRTCNTMALTAAWMKPPSEALEWARNAYKKLVEAGDIYFACYAAFFACVSILMRGQDLQEDAKEMGAYLRFTQDIGFPDGHALIATYERTVACLRGKTRHMADFSDGEFDSLSFEASLVAPRMNVAIQCYWTMKTMLHFLDGNFDAALAAAERFYTDTFTEIHHIRHLEYHYFAGLSAAAAARESSSDRRAELARRLRQHRDAIAKWSDATNSPTFLDRRLLLEAELAQLEGETLLAEELYEQSVSAAQQNGFLQCQAIASEMTAAFYRARRLHRVATSYLREAFDLYARWGATAKTRQLGRNHPELRTGRSTLALPARGITPVSQIDFASVLKRSPAVSTDLAVDDLVTTLMRTLVEHAGAQRALLMLIRGEALEVVARAETRTNGMTISLDVADASGQRVPASVTRYVMRSGESIVVDDASGDSRFSRDPDVQESNVRSLLCLPVARNGSVKAILYAENNLASGVFTPSHVEVLSLLSAHATVFIENARLYADLEAREAKIRRIFDLDVIGIVFWDLSGQLLDANDAFLRIVGYSREELESGSMRWFDMTPPEWQRQVPREVQELNDTGALKPVEKEFFRKDGSRVPVLMGAATFEGTQQQGVAIVVDISKQKDAEARAVDGERRNRLLHAELAHANRVATMGHLAAGIAHDVKQPLAGIVASGNAGLQWLANDPPNLPAAGRALERSIRDAMRAAAVLDRTRSLVKKTAPQLEEVDLNAVVSETVALVSPEANRKGILLRQELGGEALRAHADRVQVQQVVMNLLVNAIEALGADDPGALREIAIRTGRTPQGVEVSVSDTGPGLPTSKWEECFEAFYSTKSDGLGMGLSICKSIVESFGGQIAAIPNRPRGAVFRFHLPSHGDRESGTTVPSAERG